ncbi:MAG: penicillin acylase family protein, partial [Pseudomonadota bacterium]
RTQSGKPLFACDPHLVLTSPSPWMIAGVSAPQLDTVGLMIPALPIFGVGRNHDGAWGGTNLHATSSELIDVADEPITTGVTTIDVRGGRNVERPLRESAWGPLISDAKPFHMPSDTVALHWLGHRPSDDFTPYLNLMKAAHWSDFQEAIDGFSLPGLNMVWADRHGDIGKMVACRVPNRPLEAPADLLTQKADAQAAWAQLLSAKDLPIVHNPEAGFVISANEAPDNARVSISLFFAEPTRAERIATLLQNKAPATLETLRIIQTDTHSAPAEKIATALSEVAGKLRPQSAVSAELSRWDGHYDAQSQGALAFELVVAGLVEGLEKATGVTSVSAAWRPFTRLTEVLRAAAPPVLAEHLAAALDAADAPFQKHKTWGGLHRLRLYHPLARLPWLMGRLPSIDLPIGGSNETVMKAMHPFTRKVHRTPFGANARFLADLAHVDETFAALLGGQDGWPGSRTMFDLVGPWRQGDMVRLPLSQSARREAFPNITTIHPHHLPKTS